jgi:NTP pyrophosphatase (non-canonical NTP hydrolase)
VNKTLHSALRLCDQRRQYLLLSKEPVMTPDEYVRAAVRTESDAQLPNDSLTVRMLHASLGMMTETGEVADLVKRWLYYGQGLDRERVGEELGDLLWYVALACDATGLSLQQVMDQNIKKLKARYPQRFTTERAAEEGRDKEGERGAMNQTPTVDPKDYGEPVDSPPRATKRDEAKFNAAKKLQQEMTANKDVGERADSTLVDGLKQQLEGDRRVEVSADRGEITTALEKEEGT